MPGCAAHDRCSRHLHAVDQENALRKCRALCARQERCQQELLLKLKAWGTPRPEKVLDQLEKEGFLNEARFAEDFAVGHFRQKGWGKQMIRAALHAKAIPSALVQSGLDAIDAAEYTAALKALAKKRWAYEKEPDPFLREQRVLRYLVGRGWEADDVRSVLASVAKR